MRRGGQIRLALIFAAGTVAAGIVVSFLPLALGVSGAVATAGLPAQSLTATVGRWWAGRVGDRRGHARLLAPSLLLSAFAPTAMLRPTSAVVVLTGMLLFGAGFGVLQNASFALMIERMPTAEAGTASALWNLAFDAGYGAGPAAFGLAVAHTGYPAAFLATALLLLAAVPAARSLRRRPCGPRDWGLAVRADEPDVVRDDDRVDPVARADLREGAADVRLDGRLGQAELAGDLRVRHPRGDRA